MYRLLFANDFSHVLGSRSYVSGLLIDTRVVAFALSDANIACRAMVGVTHAL
ncbi:MAG: hypothetical protein ABJK03_04740 [Paracoccaceae bacterium]